MKRTLARYGRSAVDSLELGEHIRKFTPIRLGRRKPLHRDNRVNDNSKDGKDEIELEKEEKRGEGRKRKKETTDLQA